MIAAEIYRGRGSASERTYAFEHARRDIGGAISVWPGHERSGRAVAYANLGRDTRGPNGSDHAMSVTRFVLWSSWAV